jgi:hypothetical protein
LGALETEVVSSGFFQTDTKRVLAAAVESLRAENKLLVSSYKGFAAVSVERDGPLFLDARQDLIVPAQVGYYLDLSGLTLDSVAYDEATKAVTIRLPPLVVGDVAFEPEGARTINGGLLTYSQAEVDQLSKLNYASARRAFVKQAQSPSLVQAARAAASRNVERYFGMAMRSAGRSPITVVVVHESGWGRGLKN